MRERGDPEELVAEELEEEVEDVSILLVILSLDLCLCLCFSSNMGLILVCMLPCHSFPDGSVPASYYW